MNTDQNRNQSLVLSACICVDLRLILIPNSPFTIHYFHCFPIQKPLTSAPKEDKEEIQLKSEFEGEKHAIPSAYILRIGRWPAAADLLGIGPAERRRNGRPPRGAMGITTRSSAWPRPFLGAMPTPRRPLPAGIWPPSPRPTRTPSSSTSPTAPPIGTNRSTITAPGSAGSSPAARRSRPAVGNG